MEHDDRSDIPLTQNQRLALLMLGYLYLRMGLDKRAEKLFVALTALDENDGRARRGLAAACLALGKGEAALEHVDRAIGSAPLPSRDAPLYLLRAKALWLIGRTDEAKNAVNAWTASGGSR